VAIKGSLKEASLADVLQLLALGQKTGCLAVTDRTNLGHIYFRRGQITYASLVNRRDRIGDILVKNGKITQEQLHVAIDQQVRKRDKRVGELLVESGAIAREELEHYMQLQIEEAVFFLFTWTRGSFNFEADVQPEEQDFLVAIKPESLVLEGARRVDEWSLIEKKIPSLDIIFTVDQRRIAASQVSLTEQQQRLVSLLDGSRDFTGLVEDSGLVEFDVGKALYGLITAGFVHRTGRSEPQVADVGDARVDEHRNLGIAFYKTGMLDEATREFRRVVEAAGHFNQAAERGGMRPAVLHNLALAYEKAGRLEEAEGTYAEAASKARRDTQIMTSWGIVALQRGDHEVAAGRLDRAREVGGDEIPSTMWFWARSLSAAALEEVEEAEALLREGLEAHPDSVVLLNNRAVLQELLGDLDGAEETLRAALSEDPSVPQLSKNLGDLHYRGGRYDEAWDAYQRAVKLQPQLGDDVYFKLGNIAYKRLDRESAAELWRKALELNPGHELARTNLDTVSALT
jgi:tetratricopeptide (TPR) repeat protein